MSRRLAAGDEKGAASAQAAALIDVAYHPMRGRRHRHSRIRCAVCHGAFTAAAAAGALSPPMLGCALVLLRSFTAPFYARGDTATPVKAALLAASVNILLKVLLMDHLAQVGLALATSVGAWLNLSLLAWFARRQGFIVSGAAIGKPVTMLVVAGASGARTFGGQSRLPVVAKLLFSARTFRHPPCLGTAYAGRLHPLGRHG
jgi:putative peptidoglycan lipid II flippase